MTKEVVSPKVDIGKRAVQGGFWTFLSRVSQQVISLVQVAVLARLIDPSEFGLMGLASLATQAIAVFVYTGYEYALVQKPDLTTEDINTAWVVMIGRRIVISLALAVLAVPITRLYNTPQALPVLLAMAAVQLVTGLASPGQNLLQRELKYRSLFGIAIASAVSGLIVGVAAAFILRNVWALFLATFSTTIAQVILSYVSHPFRPRFFLRRESLRSLSEYGKWMLGSAVLWFVFSQGTDAYSGWLFGATALGYYQMAGRFALLASTQLGEVILGTVFPVYSIIQDDPSRIKVAFLKVLSISAMLILGATGLIAWGLPTPVTVLLGDAWQQSTELIPLIAFAGGMRALLRTGSPLFLGKGKPKYQFYMDLVQASVMMLLLYPLGKGLGLPGMPYATLLGAFVAAPIWWFGIQKITGLRLFDVAKAIVPSVAGLVIIRFVFILENVPAKMLTSGWVVIAWYILLASMAGLGYIFNIWVWERIGFGYRSASELFAMVKKWLPKSSFSKTRASNLWNRW